MLWWKVWERIEAELQAQGYDDIGPSHLPVFRYPGPHGVRPTELAERAQTTKQAMNYLLSYLESRGYLRREPDALDGRGRVVLLTERGHRVVDVIVAAVDEVEREWEARVGTRRWHEFLRTLEELNELPSTPPAGRPGAAAGAQTTDGSSSRPSSQPRRRTPSPAAPRCRQGAPRA